MARAQRDYTPPSIRIELRPVEEHAHLMPHRLRAPKYVPIHFPVPRTGEVLYLSSTSAWGVSLVVHEWVGPDELLIVIWLRYRGATHHAARTDFAPTQ